MFRKGIKEMKKYLIVLLSALIADIAFAQAWGRIGGSYFKGGQVPVISTFSGGGTFFTDGDDSTWIVPKDSLQAFRMSANDSVFFQIDSIGTTEIRATTALGIVPTTAGLFLNNRTQSDAGVTVQMPPRIWLRGHGWDTGGGGAGDNTVDWYHDVLPASGTTVSSTYRLKHSLAGAAETTPFSLTSGGTLTATVLTGSSTVNAGSDAQMTSTGYVYAQTYVRSKSSTARASMQCNLNATATAPVFHPNGDDDNTGIGWAAGDQLSLIAGGVEGIRVGTKHTTNQLATQFSYETPTMVNNTPTALDSAKTYAFVTTEALAGVDDDSVTVASLISTKAGIEKTVIVVATGDAGDSLYVVPTAPGGHNSVALGLNGSVTLAWSGTAWFIKSHYNGVIY